ncbi:MAG: ribonuclease III domain-containing protein [Cyanobacteria bacterium P01_G01_bin.54]
MTEPKPIVAIAPSLCSSAIVHWAGAQCLSCSGSLPPESPPERLTPNALAYIGDSVYELYMRLAYLLPPRRIADYHQQVVNQVRAEQQARYLALWQPHLTPQEQDWVRRGRNATTRRPPRLAAQVYQQASGFETLIGYLYLSDRARLQELFGYLWGEEGERLKGNGKGELV